MKLNEQELDAYKKRKALKENYIKEYYAAIDFLRNQLFNALRSCCTCKMCLDYIARCKRHLDAMNPVIAKPYVRSTLITNDGTYIFYVKRCVNCNELIFNFSREADVKKTDRCFKCGRRDRRREKVVVLVGLK
jgi:hypothetical protein